MANTESFQAGLASFEAGDSLLTVAGLTDALASDDEARSFLLGYLQGLINVVNSIPRPGFTGL